MAIAERFASLQEEGCCTFLAADTEEIREPLRACYQGGLLDLPDCWEDAPKLKSKACYRWPRSYAHCTQERCCLTPVADGHCPPARSYSHLVLTKTDHLLLQSVFCYPQDRG